MRKSKRRSRKRVSRKRVSPFRAQRPALSRKRVSRTQSKRRRTRKRAPSARKRRLSYKVSGGGPQYPHTIRDFLADKWSIPTNRRSLIGPPLPSLGDESWISPERRTNYFTAYTRPTLRHFTPYEPPERVSGRWGADLTAENLLKSIGYHNGMSPNENFQNLLNNYGYRLGGVKKLEEILSSDWGTKYLIKAIYMDDIDLVRFLLNLKKDMSLLSLGGPWTHDYTQPRMGGDFLINVSQSVSSRGIPLSSERGFDENDYITPLYMAVRSGESIVRLLLERGAKPNVYIHLSGNDGVEQITPLYLAITNIQVQIVELLLDYGAKPNKSVYIGSDLPDYRNKWYSPLFLSLREISNECYEPEVFRGPRYCGDAELIYDILRKTEYDAKLLGKNDRDILEFPIANHDNYKLLFSALRQVWASRTRT